MPRLVRLFPVVLVLALCTVAPTRAQQWDQQTVAQTVPGLWGIAMADSGRGIAVGNANIPLNLSGIIRKSTGNPTWQLVPTTSFTPALTAGFPFWSAATAVKGTGTMFVTGSNAQVYKSADYGATWNRATTGITGSSTFFDIHFKNATEGMVVGNGGLAYYTSDGGANWVLQTTGVTGGLYSVHTAGSVWYVSGAANTLLKFTPPSTWTNISVSTTVGTFPLIEGLQFLTDQVGTISGYNVSGSSHVFRTTDGGANWAAFPQQPPLGTSNFYNTIFFFDQQTGWVGNAFSAIARTTDGGTSWTPYMPNGSGQGAISRIDFTSQQDGWAAGGAVGGAPSPGVGYVLRYTGPAPQPTIVTSTGTIDFDTVRCELSRDRSLVVSNTGQAPLRVDSITFPQAGFVVASPPVPFTVQPGQQQTVTVRWIPDTTFNGGVDFKFSIWSNDPLNTPMNVRVLGFRNKTVVSLSTFALNFGNVCLGGHSDLTLTVTPDPVAPSTYLSMTHRTGSNMLVLVDPQPGQNLRTPTVFTFRFAPATGGAHNGTYELRFGNPGCPQVVTIAYSGQALSNDVALSTSSLDFGDVCAGQSKDLTVTITNTGSSPATVLSRELVSGSDLFPNQHAGGLGPIAPGGTATYTVRFAPGTGDVGVQTATYRLIVGTCPDTVEYTVTGRAVRTSVAVAPGAAIALGPITPGQTATRLVTFTNNSTGPITATDMRMTPVHPGLTLVGLPSFPKVVQPGETITMTVTFSPTAIASISSRVCLVWSLPCPDSLCMTVSATATDPASILVGTAKDLGLQRCTAPARDSIVVRNLGPGPLNLLGYDMTGAQAGSFRVVQPAAPVLIAAGDSVHLVIEFDGAGDGPASATLGILHNDATKGSRSNVALTARRESALFMVEGDTSTTSMSCVGVPVQRTLTIRSTGTRAVEISTVVVTQGAQAWSVATTGLPVVLQPGQTHALVVTFTPRVRGVQNAQIVITSSECMRTHVVTLQGEGSTSNLTWLDGPINFGTVDIGATGSRTVRLTNTGQTPATIDTMLPTPASSALRLVAPTGFPVVLQPGQTIPVTLEYAPTTVGSTLAELCAIASAPCPDTVCMPVIGIGRSDGIGLDRAVVDLFLTGCAGEGDVDTVRIVNNSPSTVTASSVTLTGAPHLMILNPPTGALVLPSGTSHPIVIAGFPYFVGTRSGTLTVTSDDPKYPMLTLPVHVRRDSINLELIPAVADAGVFALCEGTQQMTLTLRNTGTRDVPVVLLAQPASPFVLTTTLPATLRAGEQIPLLISVTPSSTGALADSLVFETPCGTRVVSQVRALVPEDPYIETPSPVDFGTVGVGSSVTGDLTIRNLYTRSARIARIVLTGTAFTTTSGTPLGIDSLGTLRIPMRFTPAGEGTAAGSICVYFDQPCPDTLCVDLVGTGADGALVWRTSPLVFGMRTQCEQEERSDTLLNNGTLPLTLSAATLSGSGSGAYTLLTPITAPEQLAPGAGRVFTLRFAPAAASDGIVTASLDVVTSSITQPISSLPLRGTKVTARMPANQTLAFGSVVIGAPTSRTITLVNTGSAPITLVDAAMPGVLSIAPPVSSSQPLLIAAGDSVTITVTLTAAAAGSIDELIVFTGLPCSETTTVRVTADAAAGFVFGGLDLGVVPACSPIVATLRFTNGTMTDVSITDVSMSAADAAFFSVVSPSSLPGTVLGGGALDVVLHLTPTPAGARVYTATCEVTVLVGGIPQTLRADVRADVRAVQLSASSLDIGSVSLTESRTRTLTFVNMQPFAITVDRIALGSSEFSLAATRPALPVTVQPGASLEVDVTFAPVSTGVQTSELSFDISAPCATVATAVVTATGVDDIVRATLSIDGFRAAPDARIVVPVVLGTDLAGRGVRSFEGAILFNPTMLYPRRVHVEGSRSQAMNLTWQYDQSSGAIEVLATGADIAAGTGPLFFIEFEVLVGDAVQTPLTISPTFVFTSGLARVETRRDGSFSLEGYCLIEGTRLVQPLRGFALHGNTPNPFNPSTVINFELDREGMVDLRVHDLTGRPVALLIQQELGAGVHRAVFDASALPSGVYVCVLRHEGRIRTRSVLLMR